MRPAARRETPKGPGGRVGLAARLSTGLPILLAAAALALVPSPAAGQEAATGPPAEAPPAGSSLQEGPAMAEAPLQFKVAATGGALLWGEETERPDLDDGALLGLDVESAVGRFVAFRLSGAYGRTSASEAEAITDVNQYVADLSGVLRLAFGPLDAAGVVPFGTLAVATVVHDPEDEELVTKSQSAWGFGAGIELDLFPRFGFRTEWRRYLVNTENLFDPMDRTGAERTADRLYGSVYWKL